VGVEGGRWAVEGVTDLQLIYVDKSARASS